MQASFQNMRQGSFDGVGKFTGRFAAFWTTVQSIGTQLASQMGPGQSMEFSGAYMESLVQQVQNLSSDQTLDLTITFPVQQFAGMTKSSSSSIPSNRSGSIGNGLTSILYQTGNNPANNNAPGISVIEGYKSENQSIDLIYNFLQTVSIDDTPMQIDNAGHWSPFYYVSSNDAAIAEQLQIVTGLGYDETTLLMDFPSSSTQNRTFNFITTVVVINPDGDGTAESGGSFSWGYTLTNGVPTGVGTAPTPIPTPALHQEIIQQYNQLISN